MKKKIKLGPKTDLNLDREPALIELRNRKVHQKTQCLNRLKGFTEMNHASFLTRLNSPVKPFKFPANPYEYKVTRLRECPTPENLKLCHSPIEALKYWHLNIVAHPYFNPDCECLVVLLLNTRMRIKGHTLVSIGTLNTIQTTPREVFRLAIIAAASSIILMHNHPSGESHPSDSDIQVTQDLLRAAKFLKIELADHIIVGQGNSCSLRELGYFDDIETPSTLSLQPKCTIRAGSRPRKPVGKQIKLK